MMYDDTKTYIMVTFYTLITILYMILEFWALTFSRISEFKARL